MRVYRALRVSGLGRFSGNSTFSLIRLTRTSCLPVVALR